MPPAHPAVHRPASAYRWGERTGYSEPKAPARPPADLYDILPQDHRLSYDMRHVLACILDGGLLDEFQPDVAREMLCGHAHIEGWPVAVIANQRGIIKGAAGERPRFGGIVYTGSAEKVAYFIETAGAASGSPFSSFRT